MNILSLGSCSIHKRHNAFRKEFNCLDIDIDQLECDIHLFFKLSSARRGSTLILKPFLKLQQLMQ